MSKNIAAGEFKAKCLAIMDEVRDRHTSVTITKNGLPVAKLVPVNDHENRDPIFGFYKGKVRVAGEIMAPLHTDEEYEEFSRRKSALYGFTRKRVTK